MTYGETLTMVTTIAIATGGSLVVAPAAFGKAPVVVTAPQSEDLVVRKITYADLNLASPAGERSLNRRVGYAVNSLCLETVGAVYGDRTATRFIAKCHASAWGQARPQISQAVQRAREIALTGTSTLAAVSVTISVPE